MIGLYRPGTTLLHRMPAGPKLLLLLVAVLATVLVRDLRVLAAAALGVVALTALARIPARVMGAQLRPLLWFLPFVAAFQWIFSGWRPALLAAGIMLVNVALAALFTLTTSVTAILDLFQRVLRPLRRFGVDPDRIGLLIALTIRCVPLMASIVTDVAQARKARGVGGARNIVVAFAAPAVIRALRTADAFGDALVARGLDD